MKKRNGLRFRIVFAFTAFAFVLGVVFAIFTVGSMHLAQGRVIEQQLTQGVSMWKARHGNGPSPEMPDLPFLKGFSDLDSMPAAERAAVEELPVGTHPLGCDQEHLRSSWVSVFEHRNHRYYFVYYQQPLFGAEGGSIMLELMMVGVFVLTLLGFILGKITGRMVVKPVFDLADLVAQTDPAELPGRLEQIGGSCQDEVGFLARRLKGALEDAEAYHEREQRFTRYASHELRTPVAIIKGAGELLELSGVQHKAVDRIQRSVTDMERLIETFLTLARQENVVPDRPTNVGMVVGDAVARQMPQLESKGLALRLTAADDVEVPVPDTVVRVLVDNLLVNAIRHTHAGEVTVTVERGAISVLDSGPGIPEETLSDIRREYVRGKDSQGYGMGLAIVEDLCSRYNWRFELRNRDSQGLLARLTFAPFAPQPAT